MVFEFSCKSPRWLCRKRQLWLAPRRPSARLSLTFHSLLTLINYLSASCLTTDWCLRGYKDSKSDQPEAMFLKFAFVLTLWPASILRGLPCLWLLLLFFHVDEILAVELSHPARLLPRNFRPDPITIPIHVLQARSPADNTTFGVGLSAVSMTGDRTCVSRSFHFTFHRLTNLFWAGRTSPWSRQEESTFGLHWTPPRLTCGLSLLRVRQRRAGRSLDIRWRIRALLLFH